MTILNNILAVSVREFRVMCTRYTLYFPKTMTITI